MAQIGIAIRFGRESLFEFSEVPRKLFHPSGTLPPGCMVESSGYPSVGYRKKTNLHGLFGIIEYKRAYYFSQHEGGRRIPSAG